MADFRYSVYPNNYGESVSFDNGIIRFGDWDRLYKMPADEVRKLYEAMKVFYDPKDEM